MNLMVRAKRTRSAAATISGEPLTNLSNPPAGRVLLAAFASLLLCADSASAQAAEVQKPDPYLPKECRGENPTTYAEVPGHPLQYCPSLAWLNADKELNTIYRKALSVTRRMDKVKRDDCIDESKQGEKCPTYEQALVNSQRAWIVLRDANSVAFSADDGGESEAIDYYVVREEETVDRIKWLNRFIEAEQESGG